MTIIMADRHIPTLMKNAKSKAQRLKSKIDYFEKLKESEVLKKETYRHKISQKDHEKKSINFDIENAEDPVNRPLDTGEEVPRIEIWIRKMESKTHHLDGDIALLKSKCLECEQLISSHKYHISVLLIEFMNIEKKIEKLESADFLNRMLYKGSEYIRGENIIDVNKEGEILDRGEME